MSGRNKRWVEKSERMAVEDNEMLIEGDNAMLDALAEVAADAAVPTTGGPMSMAAGLFDAFSRGTPVAAKALAEHGFAVIGGPGEIPAAAAPGDILIERALAEGALASVSVVSDSRAPCPVCGGARRSGALVLRDCMSPQSPPRAWILREGRLPVGAVLIRPFSEQLEPIETVVHSCRPGEGPPAALPDPEGKGLHPLVYRGTGSRRSRNPTVGDAQILLNRFLERLGNGTFPCRAGANLIAIQRLRATMTEDPLVVDCRFGPSTEKATQMFQRCVFPTDSREWDGKMGPKTWRELVALRSPIVPPPGQPTTPRPDSPIELDYFARHADAVRYIKLSAGQFAFFTGVEPLAHGDTVFAQLRDELQRTTDEIYIVSWFCEPALELDRSNWDQSPGDRDIHRLEHILLSRARAGVTVRLLIWNFLNLGIGGMGGSSGPPPARPPQGLNPIMRQVRRLGERLHEISPRNEVVIDEHPTPFATRTVAGISLPIGGSHHQKIWIMRSGEVFVGFCGGINLRQHDWDTHQHDIRNPRRNPADMEGNERKRKYDAGEDPDYPPRHDWTMRVEGPGALLLLQEFNLRWGMAGRPKLTLPAIGSAQHGGSVLVQKSHTLPVTFGGGSREILEAYEHAISQARRYVFIENQYWTSEALTRALADRVARVPDLKVVFVLPDKAEDAIVGPFISGEQWHQLSELWRVAGTDRVRAYTLYKKHPLRSDYVNIYVHSKIAIIDDLWATIGSANTNNRSMILDTECNMQIVHGPTVARLRKSAWRELLAIDLAGSDDAVTAITGGWHPIGEANARRMASGEQLQGLIVPVREPENGRRPPEFARPFM